MAKSIASRVSLNDMQVFAPLLWAYPKWRTAEELRRRCNAHVPWWVFWPRWTADRFRHLLDDFLSCGWVESRWEHHACEHGHVAERQVFRLVVRETADGQVPQLLLDMRKVVSRELERR